MQKAERRTAERSAAPPPGGAAPFCAHGSAFCVFPLALFVLAPAFALAGLLLAGIPIVIHILNRRRYRTVRWAAMDFLLRAMKKNRRRLRFESWLLLALRCAVLALLGLALARPLSCADSSLAGIGQRGGLAVFVIDNSYSMAYEADRPGAKTHFDQAKKLAEGLIDRMGGGAGGDCVAIITAGRPAAAVLEKPTYDLQQARSIIDRIPQGYGGTDLAEALRLAGEIGRDNPRAVGQRQLYLFTDATRSAWLAPDAASLKSLGPDLAKLYQITLFNLSRGPQWNEAVTALRPSANLVTVNNIFGGDFTATVRGFGNPEPAAPLQWRVDDNLVGGAGAVPAGLQTPPVTQSQIVFRSPGPHVVSATILGGDRLAVDDTRRRVVNVVGGLKVLIVEGQRGVGPLGGSGAFLQLALAPPEQGGGSSGGSGAPAAPADGDVVPQVISDLELPDKVLSDYRAVILCGVGQIQPAEADQLQAFVQNGGTLMLFMGEPVTSEDYNTVLLPRHLMPGPLTRRVSAEADQSFAFDFNPAGPLHPLLHAFAHQEKTGLDRAQIYTYWQADVPDDPQERVLNYRQSSPGRPPDPAITVHTLGQGRVVFVSTTANADWTTLPAKPAYVALVNELLSGSINSEDGWMNLAVGQRLMIPATVKFTATPTLADPHGRPVRLDADPTGAAAELSPPLAEPGIYTVRTGSTTLPIAVNVPPEEADVRTVDDAVLGASLGGAPVAMAGDQLPAAPDSNSIPGGATELGWDVMLAVLAIVGLECFLAMWFGHHRREQTSQLTRARQHASAT